MNKYKHLRNSETFEKIRLALKNPCSFSVRAELDYILYELEQKIEDLTAQRDMLNDVIKSAQHADVYKELKSTVFVTDRTLQAQKRKAKAKEAEDAKRGIVKGKNALDI